MPEPLVLPLKKPTNAWRIFIFGESAALGDPEPAYGFGRVLEVLLLDRYPGRTIEVVNVGITAINSHVILPLAKDCAKQKGDAWILYIGNNEVVGPFGAGTVFGKQSPPRAAVRASIAWQSTRIGQLSDRVRSKFQRSRLPTQWGGMEMFLKQQVAAGDARLQAVYQSYRENLRDIADTGLKSGAKVFLCTLAANLKDCAPFGCLDRAAEANTNVLQLAEEKLAAGQANDALPLLQTAAATNSTCADLQFLLGRAALSAGDTKAAAAAFSNARDSDTLRFRADSAIESIVREVASQRPAIRLVDLEKRCAESSPGQITGSELLYEHVHFNFDGNYRVARLLAEEVETALATTPATRPWLEADECARRLALTPRERARVLEEMVARLQLAPFIDQLNHTQRLAQLQTELNSWRGRIDPAAEAGVYEAALSRRPNDRYLRENRARFLQQIGQPKAAEEEWRRLFAQMPFYASAYYGLGNVLDVQGRSAEAVEFFERSLELSPRSVEALNGLGLALMNLGELDKAERRYREAIELRPDFAEAWVNLGLVQMRRGQLETARTTFEAALKLNPSSLGARINLGKTFALQSNTAAAEQQYRKAVELRPDHAIAHFNLANALSGRDDAASLRHYGEAVRLDPSFAEAQLNLGLALAKAGQIDQALPHFEKAVQLQPDSAEAHLNWGVGLAKVRRFPEAAIQFRECLRLEPTNAMAARFLQQAEGR